MKSYNYLLLLFAALSLMVSTTFAQINFERNDAILVLKENGDTLKNPWAGGFNSVQFSEIDLNLDGIMDLFVFDRTGNRVSTYINSGIPNQVAYQHAPSYVPYFPQDLKSWVLLRDYNCDGKIDLLTYSSGAIAAYLNTSTTELSFALDSFKINSNYSPDTDTTNYLPLYISSSDIPAIDDIDNDGDLDILTFSILGSKIEYHKNLSIERNGNCNELDFQLSNKCWGYFHENALNNGVVLNDTCDFNISNPQKQQSEKKHSGSTLFTLDVDANTSKELVLGDLSYNNFVMLTNSDVSSTLDNSYMIASDSLFPQNNGSTVAVNLEVFPAGYYLDVNNDNIKDLIASTNCHSGCNNKENVLYYENTNASNLPDFSLTTNSFLQEGMIEVGEGAHPVFFDYNSDGLMDFIVANYGVYNPTNGSLNYSASLSLYENIGTPPNPSYQLVNTDYIGLSTMNLDIAGSMPTLGLHPSFGDLDNDGDLDLILGDYNGKIHYFNNIGGPGNLASFTLQVPEYLGIDVGQNATPYLYDLNGDNKLDLIIGKTIGTFSYYENQGTTSSPNFVLTTENLGMVTTESYGGFGGNSCPVIIDSAGTTLLFSGSKDGDIYKFGNIDNNLTGTFTRDSSYLKLWDGASANIAMADINTDGNLDLLIGNYSGGVSFYKGSSTPPPIGVQEISVLSELKVYPNPTQNSIVVDLQKNEIKNASIQVIDALGKTLLQQKVKTQKTTINLRNFAKGIYILQFSNDLGRKVLKVVKK